MTSDGATPPLDRPRSRAALLAASGRGAVVLLLGGRAAAAAAPSATGAARGDLATLRLLGAGERLAVELYERAERLAGVPPAAGVWIAGALVNERDHLRAIAAAAPTAASAPVRLAADPRLATWPGLLGVAHALETALCAAYLSAVETLASSDLRVLAAAISANESQHLAAVQGLRDGAPPRRPAIAPAPDRVAARRALAGHAAGPLPA